jgi:vacuolar-type H+-ATPase subunit H
MATQTPGLELSPLDQIRQTEAEVTRRVAAARELAGQSLESAKKEAARMIAQAREIGLREGQARYQEIFHEAEEEAKQLVTRAQGQVEVINQRGDQRMQQAVQQVVSIVIGLEEDVKDA